MAHIVLCWELGGHFGHLSRLMALANGLYEQHHQVDFIVRDLQHLNDVAGLNTPFRFFQAPTLQQRFTPSRRPANYSEILLCNGYLNSDTLRFIFKGWVSLFELLSPDVLVFNYAPTAQLASRLFNIHCLEIGSAYFIHPAEIPMPNIGTQQHITDEKRAQSDHMVLKSINTLFHELQQPKLDQVYDIFNGMPQFLTTYPELDCYQHKRNEIVPIVGMMNSITNGIDPKWPSTSTYPKIFLYLKPGPMLTPILQVLSTITCEVRAYINDISDEDKNRYCSDTFHISKQPYEINKVLRGCNLAILNGGHDSLAQALMAGVPVLNNPTQYEQFENSLCAYRAQMGLVIETKDTIKDIKNKIIELLENTTFTQKAQAFAKRNKHLTVESCVNEIVRQCENQIKKQNLSFP